MTSKCQLQDLLLLFSLVSATFAFPLALLRIESFIPYMFVSKRLFDTQLQQGSQDEVQSHVDDPRSMTALSLTDLLRPSASCDPDQMGGTDLAYIGDVVFELFCRSRHVWPAKRTSDLQNQVVAIVRGKSCLSYTIIGITTGL